MVHPPPGHDAVPLVAQVGERRKGIERLPAGSRRQTMLDWLEVELPGFFAGRLLPSDARVADRWGRLLAAVGRPVPAVDSLLGATVLAHGLTLVTRNVRDFRRPGLPVIDPWVGE